MIKNQFHFIALFFIAVLLSCPMQAQSWKFIKEKDSIEIYTIPTNGLIPEHDNLVRIKDFRQTWTISTPGKDRTHVVLEGFIDPAGAVPDWLSNMLLTDTPLKAISGLRERMRQD